MQLFFLGLFCVIAFIILYKDKMAREEIKKQALNKQIKLARQQEELSQLSGLEKIYAMEQIRINNNIEAINILRANSKEMLKYTLESEKDWATRGGLASGIAGPVAGYVAAKDAIIDNQRIRAENEARKQNQRNIEKWADAALAMDRNSSSLAQLREEYITYYDLSPQQIFEKMKIQNIKYEIDEITGAITVKATAVKINELVKAPGPAEMCFDGALRADLFSTDGRYVGCAYLVFPKAGFEHLVCFLEGICPQPQIKDTSYTINITFVNLWELYTMSQNRFMETIGMANYRRNENHIGDYQFWDNRFHKDKK